MCGIAGILYQCSGLNEELDLASLIKGLEEFCQGSIDLSSPPFDDLLELEKSLNDLREYPAFAKLYADSSLRCQFEEKANALELLEKNSQKQVLESSSPLSTQLIEKWNSFWVRLRDLTWLIKRDVLDNLERVSLIIPDHLNHIPNLDAWKITAVLNDMARLEVRGRDSLGINISVNFEDRANFQEFLDRLNKAGLNSIWNSRQGDLLLQNLSLRVDTSSDSPSVLFVYKVSQEVGSLGDNIINLRKIIKADAILWLALTQKVSTNIWSHTRWASNGVISVVNCHPVDERLASSSPCEPSPYWITAALNGDVDNFQELIKKVCQNTDLSVPSSITTDAKIIPVLVNYYKRSGCDMLEAFRKSVKSFEGSVAISMSSSLEPNCEHFLQNA